MSKDLLPFYCTLIWNNVVKVTQKYLPPCVKLLHKLECVTVYMFFIQSLVAIQKDAAFEMLLPTKASYLIMFGA